MAASSRKSRGQVLRSLSPSGRFSSPYASQSPSSSSSAFAFSSSSFSSRSSTFFNQQRSISPPRVNLYNHSPSSSSVRFSIDNRPISPNRSISAVRRNTEALKNLQNKQPKRTCMCSPTTHPGSFRCSLHKGFNNTHAASGYAPSLPHISSAAGRRFNRGQAGSPSCLKRRIDGGSFCGIGIG
ncbi:hypothetical protein V6N13_118690 [Hibiscus sabdariffa]|uniref:Serine-rich protein-like protein n=1 Tax=Hibiscus sabdariffa TaxID=183260 RepID=A0ABR2E0P7_9ROSI